MAKKTLLRFAHPFFTEVPVEKRPVIPGIGRRMTDFVAGTLEKIPAPKRNPPRMTLAEIVGDDGANAIDASGSITFHAAGDSGHTGGRTEDMQEFVADAMAADIDITKPATSPAFFFHLGDVIYYDNTDRGYQEQFYVPYKRYPGKIIAIPGNHDGELFRFDGKPTGQKTTLEAFTKNFLQPKPGIPSAAGTIFREMVSQPGVFWRLGAPYVDIVALYSNIAEGPGFIGGQTIGNRQTTWLLQELTAIKADRAGKRKALIIAVHHPPFSNGSHASSALMLDDIDAACTAAKIQPDMVLAAHSHDYERYTRFVAGEHGEQEIPFIVVGGAGRGLSPKVAPADGVRHGQLTYEKSLRGYGYLKITVDAQTISALFFHVEAGGGRTKFDGVRVDLRTGKIE
jgi:Calcineurin-like phosphoesterase